MAKSPVRLFGHFNNLVPWWVPAPMTALLLGALNWALGLSGTTILIFSAVALVTVGLLTLIPDLRVRYGLMAAFVGLALYGVIREYQDAQKYEVAYEDLRASADPTSVPPGEPPVLRGFQLKLVFGNMNDFEVNERSQRRAVAIDNKTAPDAGEDSGMPMPARRHNFQVISSVIDLRKEPISLPTSGTMDFAVCFAKGKDNTKFDKQFRMKGTFDVVVRPDGSLGIVNFRPAAPEGENNGFYEGCPR